MSFGPVKEIITGHSRMVTQSRLPFHVLPEHRTTVILRNLPASYTRDSLCGLFDNNGFAGEYDFIYAPIDPATRSGQGIAVVNLVDPLVAARFWDNFDGFSRWW